MLYLEAPIYFINGLQIHTDFQNPNQFYYFPASPRIHYRDGEPAFQLLKYARDVTDNPLMPPGVAKQVGGAFLMFTVDIGIDEETLQDTRMKLAAFAEGEVMLAPVPFHTGAVRLIGLGAQSEVSGSGGTGGTGGTGVEVVEALEEALLRMLNLTTFLFNKYLVPLNLRCMAITWLCLACAWTRKEQPFWRTHSGMAEAW